MPKKLTARTSKSGAHSAPTAESVIDQVMNQIDSGQVKMRPRWFFVLGSAAGVLAAALCLVTLVFAFNIFWFYLRQHGPMAAWRLQNLLSAFPWWAPLGGLVSGAVGWWLLRRSDLSYRYSPLALVTGILVAAMMAAWLLDYAGLSDLLARRGMMRRLYLNSAEQLTEPVRPSPGWRRGGNGLGTGSGRFDRF